MRPLLHELRHTLGGAVAVAAIVLLLLGAALAYSQSSNNGEQPTIAGAGFYTYANGAYHIVLYVFDEAGHGVPGASVYLDILSPANLTNFTNPTPAPSYGYLGSADGQGRVVVNAAIPNGSYLVRVTVANIPYAPVGFQENGALLGFDLGSPPPGAVGSIDAISEVAENLYSQTGTLLFVWAGPGGAPPSGADVLECHYLFSPGNISPFPQNCSGLPTETLGTLSSYETILAPLPAPVGSIVLIELRDPSAGIVSTYTFGDEGQNPFFDVPQAPSLTVGTPGAGILSEFEGTAPLLVGLAGFLLAYLGYARPRLSGTLEPVLVRPVTRPGLLLARYAAVSAWVAGLSGGLVLVVGVGADLTLGTAMPASYALPLFAALLVPGLGFAGVVFAAAHAFRSTAAPLGLGLGLFAALSLFWYPLSSVVFLLTAGSAPSRGAATLFQAQAGLLSPAQLPSYVLSFLTGSATAGGSGAEFARAGITPAVVALVGVLWVVPFVLVAYVRAVRAD